MGRFDFAAGRKQAEADGQLSANGEAYKYKEGDNRMRLMSECLPHKGDYKGRPTFKWLCYVLDRRDGHIKAHFMPHLVYKQIETLQVSEEYAFDEVPMPYDITVRATKAGTKEVEYILLPARKETPLTEDERSTLADMTDIRDVQRKIQEKHQAGSEQSDSGSVHPPHDDGAPPITDSDIPF